MQSRNPTIFLRNAVILFLGVLTADWLIDPIHADSTTTLLLVALVLTLLNMVVKPLLVLFALPFVIFTLGLGILLINAVLLYLAGALVPGFEVPTFGVAFLGAFIISILNLLVSMLLPPRPQIRVRWSGSSTQRTRRRISDKDVIDV